MGFFSKNAQDYTNGRRGGPIEVNKPVRNATKRVAKKAVKLTVSAARAKAADMMAAPSKASECAGYKCRKRARKSSLTCATCFSSAAQREFVYGSGEFDEDDE